MQSNIDSQQAADTESQKCLSVNNGSLFCDCVNASMHLAYFM